MYIYIYIYIMCYLKIMEKKRHNLFKSTNISLLLRSFVNGKSHYKQKYG